MEDAAHRANVFVTTTGNRDIITAKHFQVMPEDAIVSKCVRRLYVLRIWLTILKALVTSMLKLMLPGSRPTRSKLLTSSLKLTASQCNLDVTSFFLPKVVSLTWGEIPVT
jgi:S-adenosyl-L-homocysteine hydrolase, NAD binding domain